MFAVLAAVLWLSGVTPAHTQGPGGAKPGPAKAATVGNASAESGPRPLRILFLGHDRPHHPSGTLLPLIAAPLARRGIQITHVYTPEEALDPAILKHYDALMIYANHKTITPAQEQALVDFVEGGKGLVAIHCASAMFTEAPRYIPLVGGEFARHGMGEFTAEIVAAQADHPAIKGLKPFTTTDETYVHKRHNPVDRTVLMERVDSEGREPYTWVRTQGKGRVFYTAYGHDQRTWSQPGFLQLIQQGTLWAVDDGARKSWSALKMPQVEYVDGFGVPNYEGRDPAPKYQMPFSPEDALKFVQTPAEFKVELFANEPQIIKPIHFTFDERGRLWVIEAVDYPNRVLRGGTGEDRIKILEDTNGDGRADKATIFADRLNLPTSLVFANGGVIVSGAPNFLFLRDTNGDDKADEKKILSTGWGMRDTHAGASNLMYGPDNYIWGTVGYSGYDGEMNGKKMQFGQGVYRFRPDGSDFEYVTGSTNNTWGLGFSETFDVFGSTANNDPSFYVAIANRYFDGVEGLLNTSGPGARPTSGPGYQSLAQFYNAHYVTPYIRQVDVHGGYTAAAGHQLYTARQFPQRYWNRIAFITEPTAHLVGQGILEKNGASFLTRDGWNLMAAAEEWVAPVHAMVGPDGAVWVADWYNFIQQHNPTPVGFSNGPGNAYETSMRDRHRGRIYRIVYRDAASLPASTTKNRTLTKSDTSGLLAALASDNMMWRLHGQRLLIERGQLDVVPKLIELVKNQSVDAIGTNGGAMHALWTLHGLGALNDNGPARTAATEALKHKAAGVRKAAAMVLTQGNAATSPARGQSASSAGAQAAPQGAAGAALLQAGLLQDPDLHTRLAAVLALADQPSSPEIGRALYAASNDAANTSDRWLSRALYIAASRHKDAFLTEYRADPNAVPLTALPLALRLGNSKPDWREPETASLGADWKEMEVPGAWETKGLPNFDGVVWFTRTFEMPEGTQGASLTFGDIRQLVEVWINGQAIAAPTGAPPTRGGPPSRFEVPVAALKPGTNRISVRINNVRGDGGFVGKPELMAIEAKTGSVPLAGKWQYRVERQTNAPTLYGKPGELAAHLAMATRMSAANAGVKTLEDSKADTAKPDVVIQLAVVRAQLKFDKSELTVNARQLVQLVFANTDEMPHNFVLGAAGALQQIGAAADAMGGPDGLAMQYVPPLPQVLFATTLVNPGDSVTVQFRAPAQAGDYPFVCTFPGHWRVMSGILRVR
jgi:putative membrane-bound dehydrogenase-like protein